MPIEVIRISFHALDQVGALLRPGVLLLTLNLSYDFRWGIAPITNGRNVNVRSGSRNRSLTIKSLFAHQFCSNAGFPDGSEDVILLA